MNDDHSKEKKEENLKKGKMILIAFIITSSLGTVIPSGDTLLKMVIAQNVTYERAEQGQEVLKDTIDYIFEKLEKGKDTTDATN